MEGNLAEVNQIADEEEYVLLDLDDVCVEADIPANSSYVLSGLDTMNPVLVIGDHMKLIGEYQETMGTCYVFSENDVTPPTLCPETKPSESISSKDREISDRKQGPSKQVKPIASLHKILKFKLVSDQNERAAGHYQSHRHKLYPTGLADMADEVAFQACSQNQGPTCSGTTLD